MDKTKQKCVICDKEFTNNNRLSKADFLLRKYCSRKCSNNATAKTRLDNPETRRKLSEALKKHVRSEEHNNNISVALKISSKAKELQFKKGKDNPGYGLDQSGDKNGNWKGGTTKANQQLRNNPQYKVWRKACLERDRYKCTDCGAPGFLQVHHIKSISEYPDLVLDIENGKTVCVVCHEKIHGRFIGKFKQKQ